MNVNRCVSRALGLALAAGAALELPAADGAATEARIDALLARMTFAEKVGQLYQTNESEFSKTVAAEGAAAQGLSRAQITSRFLDMIAAGRCGSLIGNRGIGGYNQLQKAAMRGRLGIPLLIGHDMIHGAITDYPIPLALASSWDTNLWHRCAAAVGPETWLSGANWTFAPMLDIARDARWGRIAESFGQDPYLGSLYGYWWTKGLQGDDPSRDFRVAACAKHFAAYGAAEGGRDYNRVEMSDSTLRNVYLAPFRGAVAAGVLTVMSAFHTYNDIPCSLNRFLLTDVLRGELGFGGFVISDWKAVLETRENRHGCCADEAEMSGRAVAAGLDMEMRGGSYVRGLEEAVARGLVDVRTIDESVRRILRVKFALGLFDRPFIDEAAVRRAVDFAANRRLAREAARKSTVLLKNERGVLPLAKGSRLALVGCFGGSTNEMRGCWSQSEDRNVENPTLRDGLAANGFEVRFASCWGLGLDCKVDEAELRAAIADCDVVVGCFGESRRYIGENASRASIDLPGEQNRAAEIIRASGKPFVAVLFNGRPLAVSELAAAADAVVEAWHPGSCGGWGVADVLCGAAEPTARLTADFPRMTGTCPKYYNRTRTGRATPDETDIVPEADPMPLSSLTRYVDCGEKSLFPFGFGLAYTTFAYANECVKTVRGTAADDVRFVFTADVSNTGDRIGTETVQLYIRDRVAEIARPRRELKRFERVTLAPGETRTVRFELAPQDLGYWCVRDWRVEKGGFYAWIAPDSDSGKPLAFAY